MTPAQHTHLHTHKHTHTHTHTHTPPPSYNTGLLLVGSVLFAHHDLLSVFKIHPNTLRHFLQTISDAYIDENTYVGAMNPSSSSVHTDIHTNTHI